MSAANAPEWKHSVKLAINTKEKKVVYAESEKDFVDLLFSLLTLPLKTVSKILSEDAMPGSLTNLHGSVEELDDMYMEQPVTKEVLLSPEVHPLLREQLMAILPTTAPPMRYYRCSIKERMEYYYVYPRWSRYGERRVKWVPGNWCGCITTDPMNTCSACGNLMNVEVTLRAPSMAAPAVVKSGKSMRDLVGYAITDDLFVLPITTLSLIKKMDITDTSILVEKDIAVGKAECIEIPKASLQSETVLTDAFKKYLE